MNRRRFFREGLREFLRPLTKALEPVEKVVHHIGSLEEQFAPTPPPPRIPDPHWLRPPGAKMEQEFRDACSRCGECVRVCPAQAIRLEPYGEMGQGVPYIDADAMACVLCDGLLCMNHCPTGALSAIPLEQINMGLAVWHEHLCVRPSGAECTICIDKCPVGETAIKLVDNRIEVLSPGCVGCGVCQHECPTAPKSITVIPRSALTQTQADTPYSD